MEGMITIERRLYLTMLAALLEYRQVLEHADLAERDMDAWRAVATVVVDALVPVGDIWPFVQSVWPLFVYHRDPETGRAPVTPAPKARPLCAVHHKPMMQQQGKRGTFWSCHEKNADGSWCTYKPATA